MKKYDLIFGLGPACSCSMCLRKAGLQHQSFPYDWLAHYREEDKTSPTSITYDLRMRADTICHEFADWFEPGDFVPFGSCAETGKDWYHDTRHRLIVLHDFPVGKPFADAFPEVLGKYRRRVGRLLRLIRKARRVLVVRLDRPGLDAVTPIDDGVYAVQALSRKFPSTAFELLLLQQRDGLPPERAEEDHPADGVTRISFDYHSDDPKALPNSPNFPRVAEFLRRRYRVRDYRTLAERLQRLRKSLGRRLARLRARFSART